MQCQRYESMPLLNKGDFTRNVMVVTLATQRDVEQSDPAVDIALKAKLQEFMALGKRSQQDTSPSASLSKLDDEKVELATNNVVSIQPNR